MANLRWPQHRLRRGTRIVTGAACHGPTRRGDEIVTGDLPWAARAGWKGRNGCELQPKARDGGGADHRRPSRWKGDTLMTTARTSSANHARREKRPGKTFGIVV